ncbi:hypothetical protein WIX39_022770 [Variovorax sp. AB1(2024)]|uniref:hypothetical protein n=1 Tax=Variovorax sp. AB1(2024) TaxID=3132214 RepID=UPI0030976010
MAGLLKPEERLSTQLTYTQGDNVNARAAVGEQWRPSFREVRAADARLNNVIDNLDHQSDAPDVKKQQEDEARDLLSYASFGQQIRATFSQDEVLLGTMASLAVPPIAMRAVPATLGRIGAAITRVGIASATNATLTAGKETALHAMQETRTMQESAYTVAGAAILGGTFQGAFEGVGGAIARRGAVGPNEQAARQAFINRGTTAEQELGKAILEPDTTPLRSWNNAPLAARKDEVLGETAAANNLRVHSDEAGRQFELFDDPLTQGLPPRTVIDQAGKDIEVPGHNGGAAYAQPGQLLARGHDTPATFPFDGVPGQYALDPKNPKLTAIATGVDALGRKILGDKADATMTFNGYMLMSKNQSTRALAADLLPLNTATRLSESGSANPMPLGSKVESFKHRYLDKLDELENHNLAEYKAEWSKMTAEQHESIVDWATQVMTNGDRARAYEMVDRFRTNAAQSPVLKGTRKSMETDLARKDFNMLAKFAGDNGFEAPIPAVTRYSRMLNQQITNDIATRGNRAGAWQIDQNADRGISETYGHARLWSRDKIIAMAPGDDIPPFVRIAARFHDPELEGTPLDQAWRLYNHFRDSDGEFSNFEFRGATGGPDSAKGVVLGHLPTNAFIDFLENDASALTEMYVKRSARAIVPREHFESPEWTKVYDQRVAHIHQEAENQIVELGQRTDLKPGDFEKEQAKILNRTKEDTEQISWALDRALGVPERQSDIVAALRTGMSGMMLGRSLNANMGDLHSMSVLDAVKRVFVEFPTEIVAGIRRAIADPTKPGSIDFEQARRLGTIQRHFMYDSMNDGMNTVVSEMDRARVSTWKRGAQWFADTTHIFSGMKAFNDSGRKMMTTDINDNFIKFLKGERSLNEVQLSEYNRFGLATNLDDEMTQRVHAQVLQHGQTVDGIDYPNAHLWDDAQAAEHFMGFNKRAINSYILEPDATTKMMIERGEHAGFFSSVLQFTSFIRAAIDKQIVPTFQGGPSAILKTYMKLAAYNYAGAYTWQLMYGKDDINDEKTQNTIWGRALNNTILLPSSLLMTAMKVMEPSLGQAGEWLGLTKKYSMDKESVPILGGVGKVAKTVKGLGQMATDDTMTDEKKEKIWMNSSQMAPYLNTPLGQMFTKLILNYQYHRDNQ